MKLLIDADFFLEALLNREHLIKDAEKLWKLLENQKIQGFMTDIGLEKICIFAKKLGGIEAVEQITSVIESMVNVKIVDNNLIQKARSFDSLDFESAVEIVCAYTWKVDAIVTQNIESFSEAKFHISPDAKLHIWSISKLLRHQTLEGILSAFTKGKNHITPFIRIVFILILISGSALALGALLHYLSGYQPSFSYEHSGKGIFASSNFYDNPFGLKGEDNSLTNDFYNDTKQDRPMVASFEIEGIYTLEDEAFTLSDTDSQLGVIPEIQFEFQEKFNGLTNNFYNDSQEDIIFYDNPLDSYPKSIPIFNDVDGDNLSFIAGSDAGEIEFLAGADGVIGTLEGDVPEPSTIIGLTALAGLGLGSRCARKKNKTKNNKNNLSKPETIPPINNLDFVVDDSIYKK
ncbi:PIN domain-containing protein [Crocosphaera sp.]|uniref:PIN domain-containing protein n=1 Tax=Crocosphaera sp. TaxID=2729996 RepID=UPI003F23F9D7|nr:PEP-CTERM sorting domain-containing protein [Crocosphaera sp.]